MGKIGLLPEGNYANCANGYKMHYLDEGPRDGAIMLLLGMMSYFFVFAALMGGMYLAIDTTAGERERGSLEPLLSLPVTRDQLILGKIAATCLFMMLSLTLSLLAFYVSIGFMPLEELGMTPNFGLDVVVAALAIFLPFILVGAALMTLVASFTKSYREAQTWLSVVLIAPTLPILIVSILTLRPRVEFMFIPSLSQHLLLVDMVKNEPINAYRAYLCPICTIRKFVANTKKETVIVITRAMCIIIKKLAKGVSA